MHKVLCFAKKHYWVLVLVALAFGALCVPASYAGNCCNYCCSCGGEGCTPGYWKQPHHQDSWVGYTPSDSFDSVFGVSSTDGLTLLEALWKGGGKEYALGRHAVAALLNAANTDVNFAYTEAEVIAMVQDAYATGDFQAAKNALAGANESGCPLN